MLRFVHEMLFENMFVLVIPVFCIMAVSYFFSVIGYIGSTVFQAMGKGNYSMYLTLARQVFMPLGFVFLLSRFGNLSLGWFAFVLSEILSAPLTLYYLRHIQHNILMPMK